MSRRYKSLAARTGTEPGPTLFYIALYNEASVEIYKDGRLVYYVCAAEDGNLVEVVDGQFVYTTETTDPVRDETTGVTTRRTTVRGTDTALELLTANDAFGRKQQTGTLLRDLSGTQEAPEFAAILADYTYKTVGDGETAAATGQVDTLESRVTYGTTMQGENTVARYGFAYDYDANGNITNEYAVAENGTRTLRYRYTYDEANQLTRVDDNTQGRTRVYEYDRGGNRVSEKLYAYTLGAVSGDPQEEIVSYYGPRLDSVEGLFRGWYDVLRTYDGKGIQYDRSGNPVSYDGKTFTWNGKQLTKITAADGSCTEFAYDANGIRTQKRQFAPDGTLEYFVDYVWQDGLLTHQNMTYFLRVTVSGETRVAEVPFSAKILYDENDMPVGSMVSDEGAVGYVRNLQGDIVALVSPEGEVLVEYSYDPWGNVTVSHGGEAVEGLEAAIVAVLCPFAYRGYNYDFTTGLYYLQSRYYNPEWGRFLNVDDTNILLATQGESLGANLFAYCGNNPVNMVDYTGYSSTSMPWLSAVLTGLSAMILIDRSPSHRFILQHNFAGFYFTEDRYGLVYARLCTKDKNQQKYYVSRVVMGTADSWNTYFKQESKRYKDWGGTMVDFFVYGMQGNPEFTSVQDMINEGYSGGLFLGTCLAIGGIGAGGLAIFQKSDNIKTYYINK